MAPDEELVDPREIDKVVSEVAGMAGRWNLFKKFLSESLRVHIHPFFCLSFSNIHFQENSEDTADLSQPPPEVSTLEATASHRLFEDVLISRYIPLEIWYTRTTIDKVGPVVSSFLFLINCELGPPIIES